MKFKNIFVWGLCVSLVGCSTILPNVKQDKDKLGKSPINNFSIKSTTDSNQIKKTFVSKVFARTTGKPVTEIINFNVIGSDLKRRTLINILQGSNKVSSAELKINGVDYATQSDFNKNSGDIAVGVNNLHVGNNTLEVKINGQPGSILNVSIEGFMRPLDLPNAIFSNIPADDQVKNIPYQRGIVGLKFMESMKVRLIQNSDGTQKLVDLNGMNLTLLNKVMTKYQVKAISRGVNESPEQLDQDEIVSETYHQKDIPNLNLFYYLQIPDSIDVFLVMNELRKLPFIEEAFPEFIPSEASTYEDPKDPYVNDQAKGWLENVHVKPKLNQNGAWQRSKGSPNVKIAILDIAFEHADLKMSDDEGIKIPTHPDLDDPERIKVINYLTLDSTTPSKKNIDHGTSAAGIVGAKSDGKEGTAGIAFGSKMLLVRSYADPISHPLNCPTGVKGPCEDSLSYSLRKTYTSENANIIVLEIEYTPNDDPVTKLPLGKAFTAEQANPLLRAYISDAVASGKSVIVPAGNHYDTDISLIDTGEHYVCDENAYHCYTDKHNIIGMPDTGSIIVGGVDNSGEYLNKEENQGSNNDKTLIYNYGISVNSDGSNYVSTNTNHIRVDGPRHGTDVSGPAFGIYTTSYQKSKYTTGKILDYTTFPGTSAAAPVIGGVAALMLSVHTGLSPKDLREILRNTAQKNIIQQDLNKPIAPMVDAYAAVQKACENCPESKFSTLSAGPNPDSKTFHTSSNGDVTITKDKFMSSNPSSPSKVNPGDIVGASLEGDLNNITVEIDGVNVPVLATIENFIAFGIPNNLSPGVKDVIIKTASGDSSVTFEKAIEILQPFIGIQTNENTRVHLNFSEGTGTTARDLTSNHNDATIFGNSLWLPSSGSLKLDGTTSYVTVAPNSSLDISKSMTVEMVFSTNENFVSGDDLILAGKYDATNGVYSNASWALGYNYALNAFAIDLYSGDNKILFLYGGTEPIVANKKYYLQVSWNNITKEFNFVLNGKQLVGSVLSGYSTTIGVSDLNEFNLSSYPIILGGYFLGQPTNPHGLSKITIDDFALHSEYRTPQQGIETSQRFGITN